MSNIVPLFRGRWQWFAPWIVPQLFMQGEALRLGENYWQYVFDLLLVFHLEQLEIEKSIQKQRWVVQEIERFSDLLWNTSHVPEFVGSSSLHGALTAEELWDQMQED